MRTPARSSTARRTRIRRCSRAPSTSRGEPAPTFPGRRRPDAKWRLTQKQLDVRRAEQAAILGAAKVHVKPGGLLVYITCSVFDGENRDQIGLFAADNPDFSPVDPEALWQRHFPGRAEAARFVPGGIVLTPARSGTDGFFFAALRRAG